MHADTLTYLTVDKLLPILGLVTFVVAFVLVVIRVIRMDRNDVESMSKLPLENGAPASNGDMKHE
jgi:hypothetical protein